MAKSIDKFVNLVYKMCTFSHPGEGSGTTAQGGTMIKNAPRKLLGNHGNKSRTGTNRLPKTAETQSTPAINVPAIKQRNKL